MVRARASSIACAGDATAAGRVRAYAAGRPPRRGESPEAAARKARYAALQPHGAGRTAPTCAAGASRRRPGRDHAARPERRRAAGPGGHAGAMRARRHHLGAALARAVARGDRGLVRHHRLRTSRTTAMPTALHPQPDPPESGRRWRGLPAAQTSLAARGLGAQAHAFARRIWRRSIWRLLTWQSLAVAAWPRWRRSRRSNVLARLAARPACATPARTTSAAAGGTAGRAPATWLAVRRAAARSPRAASLQPDRGRRGRTLAAPLARQLLSITRAGRYRCRAGVA